MTSYSEDVTTAVWFERRSTIELLISARAFLPAGINDRARGRVIAMIMPHATHPTTGLPMKTNLRKARHITSENDDAIVKGASNR